MYVQYGRINARECAGTEEIKALFSRQNLRETPRCSGVTKIIQFYVIHCAMTVSIDKKQS